MIFIKKSFLKLILFISIFFKHTESKVGYEHEESPEFWLSGAQQELDLSLDLENLNRNVAKNVIIMLGDGMGIPTITAGRILKGQLEGNSGEETELAMDRFPHLGLSKTYAVDKQVADSASTATAYLCGVKGNYYTIGLSGAAKRDDCSSVNGTEVDSVLVDAYKAGKSTGLVTTTRVNHATPAGLYAHTPSRTWYDDGDLTIEARRNGCKDIAQQFIDSSHMFTVALGGGRAYFQPQSTFDPEYPRKENNRRDGQDMITQWLDRGATEGLNVKYVWNKTEFDDVNPTSTDRLLGLFEDSDMRFEADRDFDAAGEPSLAEMTEKAIQMLQKNQNGFFLLVEGGRIDHGHHASNAFAALHDFVAFDRAIAKAVEMTSESDTLIIVTADHSHTFNFGGYTDRGNPIFGLAVSDGEVSLGLDRKPFTSLLYGNGIGFQGFLSSIVDPHSLRENLTGKNTEARTYFQQSAVPLVSETHGGEDVPIMARGPMSHLIHGVHQQSYIAYVMRFAACMGADARHCSATATSKDDFNVTFLGIELEPEAAEIALYVEFACLIIFVLVLVIMSLILGSTLSKLNRVLEKNESQTKIEKL